MKPSCLALSMVLTACFSDIDMSGVSRLPPDSGLDPPETSEGTTVTLATFNVEDFDLGGDGSPQHLPVARFAQSYGVDILVLQEIQHGGPDDDAETFSRALESLDYPMPYQALTPMSDGHNAVGLWSRFPVDAAEALLPENTRTVLRARVTVGQSPVWIYGCHLKAGTAPEDVARRTAEASRLAALLLDAHDPAATPLVVLGDMNTASEGDWLQSGTLAELTLTSDNPGNADNDLVPVNRQELPENPTVAAGDLLLDHILLSAFLWERYTPGSVAVPHPDGDGPHGPSDHFPVLLDLRL